MSRRARSLLQWTLVVSLAATKVASTPEWTNDLSPIGPRDWTPAAVAALAAMTPERAVDNDDTAAVLKGKFAPIGVFA